MELIKKIEVIENNKLANIKIVFNLFAFNAFKAMVIKKIPFYFKEFYFLFMTPL
jgi:hypothetical protein